MTPRLSRARRLFLRPERHHARGATETRARMARRGMTLDGRVVLAVLDHSPVRGVNEFREGAGGAALIGF